MRKDCFVYYNTNYDVASGVQTIALLSGKNSNLRGPYHQTTTHGEVDMYQVYCSKAEAKPIAMNFNMAAKKSKKRILSGGNKKEYHGMVSCFTVPNSTLITRVDGKIAITGNCKFAYHIIRLLVECRQLLAHGKIFYPFQGDEYDQIMRIRRGEVEYQELLDMIETYEEAIAPLKEDNCLVKKPDFNFFNDWLVDTLIKHISGYRS
jgi:hypothetical protein